MRILQVTAHYPPDFISGGSLMPAMCAAAAREAGHESYVFSGDLNSLDSLEVADTVEDGIPVRWVGITSFLSWADQKNFDNPGVVEIFGRYLDEITPDIVHLHSIQTLGGGLIAAAACRGIKVVVSMHDFWWVCSRQFLVDRDMTPCSLVVSCGSCQCAVSDEWLAKRTAWLFGQLALADLILVPSASMGEAIIANGVDAAKVKVNENGVDVPPSVERVPSPTVRFMYAGGDSPIKGRDVLEQAWAAACPNASLDVYGTTMTGAGITSHEPFSAEDKADIFAAHDVLILPSLARESHSILTREALASGMTVIASDTLGPEEAVRDRVNGRIVSAGDVDSLALAISELADRDVADDLMGKGSASPITTPAEHRIELLGYYEGLGQSPSVVDRARSGLISDIVFVIGIQGAPARYRAHLPAEALRLRGKNVTIMNYRDPALAERVLGADAVVFYRVPATHQILDLIHQVRSLDRVVPILGDVDDLIFDPEIEPLLDNLSSLSPEERDLWRQGIHRYRTTLEACDAFVGSTATVSSEGARLMGMRAHSYANGVGALIARVSEQELARPRKDGPLRIGFFSGTKTHDADWASIEPAIARVMEGSDVELWLGGLVEPSDVLAPYEDRIVRLPLVAWHELPAYLRDIDVNLAPLTASIFNEAKSAIKWLEAALVQTPTVAYPTQPFAEVITPLTGRLAATQDAWVEALEELLGDEGLRASIGRAAHRHALMTLSPGIQGQIYEQILTDTYWDVRENGHRSGSQFPPVAIDEPPTPRAVDVEPYALPGSIRTPSALERGVRTVARSIKADGVSATVKKIASRLR